MISTLDQEVLTLKKKLPNFKWQELKEESSPLLDGKAISCLYGINTFDPKLSLRLDMYGAMNILTLKYEKEGLARTINTEAHCEGLVERLSSQVILLVRENLQALAEIEPPSGYLNSQHPWTYYLGFGLRLKVEDISENMPKTSSQIYLITLNLNKQVVYTSSTTHDYQHYMELFTKRFACLMLKSLKAS